MAGECNNPEGTPATHREWSRYFYFFFAAIL